MEHCVLLLRVVILTVSPSSPRWVNEAKETLSYRMEVKYRSFEELERSQQTNDEYMKKIKSGYRQLKTHLKGKTRADIEQIFEETDADKGGALDAKELNQFLTMVGVTFTLEECTQAVVEIHELGGLGAESPSGEIQLSEIFNWLLSKKLWADPFDEFGILKKGGMLESTDSHIEEDWAEVDDGDQ